ncbi:hypothetical protein MUP01_04700 [Candidatus Bathyarchaeota archaeon]|nr:hypothetical protein [Candidatus Bathyarchaeota archaeon]
MSESEETVKKRVKEQFEKAEEEYKAKKAEKAKAWNPADAVARGKKVVELDDPVFGHVKFVPLKNRELWELYKIQDLEERSNMMVLKMLKPVWPDLTLDDVRGFPADDATRWNKILSDSINFQPAKSLTGSTQT